MGCHFLLHGIFPDPLIELVSPALQVVSLLTELPGKPASKSYLHPVLVSGFPWWLSGKESTTCNVEGASSIPWSGKTPWRRKWQHTPVFLPGKSHGERSLVGYSPWGHKRIRQDLAIKQQLVSMNPSGLLLSIIRHS